MDPTDSAHVQFGEETAQQPGSFARSGTSSLARWIIAHSGGLVPDERRARYVMVALVIFAIAATFLLLREGRTYVKQGGPGPSTEELDVYRNVQPF
ncbi:hypothetical protein HY416_03385 [Candidatus Kaiserbacteria bacterium]|nr:hypothetical protein [Candidatus Kaiserbacteria bacterium]